MRSDIYTLLPMATTVIGAFVMLLLSSSKSITLIRYHLITVAVLLLSLALSLPLFGSGKSIYPLDNIFHQAFIVDDFSILFDIMFLGGAVLTLLVNTLYLKKRDYYNGEFYALFLFTIFGMMILAHSNDLIVAFIGLEVASLSIYALVGYHKNSPLSSEAMLKYMVLGAFVGSMFLLGSVMIYILVGSTNIADITSFIQSEGESNQLVLTVAGTLLLVTILFKVGAVPFHTWVMDVYEGSPFPVTMFMASVFKISIFAIALRIYVAYFATGVLHGDVILSIVTIVTLIGGSLLAISQTTLKRVLAGSSIVHGGYMLIALSSIGLGSQLAVPAVMFYLLSYFVSSVGAFGILSYLSADSKRALRYEDFKGFADKRPYLSAMMAIFMLSLSGFPSTIGFLGKFYIFTVAIESKQFLLAALGIAVAFVSIYYYFKLIAFMYFYSSSSTQKEKFKLSLSTSLIALMAILAILGGIGTSLIPMIPGADSLLGIASVASSSLGY